MRVLRKQTPLVLAVIGMFAVLVLVVMAVVSQLNKSVVSDTSQESRADVLSLQFAAAGDFGNTSDTIDVLSRISAAKPTFAIALGDLSYDNTKNEQEWCDIVTKVLGKTFPFELVAGNHDTEESSKKVNIDRFAACLPNRMSNMQGRYGQQYFFDYGRLARFIQISPGLTINAHSYNYTKDAPDYAWLQQTIDEARIAQIPWVVVSMHKNCLTAGVKTCETGIDLLNLLVEKKVDLVLQGHEHAYMRTNLLVRSKSCPTIDPLKFSEACIQKSSDATNNSYKAGLGSILAIVGTGGMPLRPVNTSSPQAPFFAKLIGSNQDPTLGALVVHLNHKRLLANFVGTDGKNHDTFSLQK